MKEKIPTLHFMTVLYIAFSLLLLGALFFSRQVVTYLREEMEKNIQARLAETSKRGATLIKVEELEKYQAPEDMSLPGRVHTKKYATL
jgi:hypothetical protein